MNVEGGIISKSAQRMIRICSSNISQQEVKGIPNGNTKEDASKNTTLMDTLLRLNSVVFY